MGEVRILKTKSQDLRELLERAVSVLEEQFPEYSFNWEWHSDYVMGLCPWHRDTRPSLSLKVSGNGEVWAHCFGCDKNVRVWPPEKKPQQRDPLTALKELLETDEKLWERAVETLAEWGFTPANSFFPIPAATAAAKLRLTAEGVDWWFTFPLLKRPDGSVAGYKLLSPRRGKEKVVRAKGSGFWFPRQLVDDGRAIVAVMVEGEWDALRISQAVQDSWEIQLVPVAVGGTSGFTPQVVRNMLEWAHVVVLAPDVDEAGQNALWRTLEGLRQKELQRVLVWEMEKKDPDEELVGKELSVEDYLSLCRPAWEVLKEEKERERKKLESVMQYVHVRTKEQEDNEEFRRTFLSDEDPVTPVIARYPFPVPAGMLGLLAGLGETGKTTLALLFPLVDEVPTMILTAEESPVMLAKRMKSLYARLSADVDVVDTAFTTHLAKDEVLELIEVRKIRSAHEIPDLISKTDKKLIVIDNLTRLIADENKNSDIAKLYRHIESAIAEDQSALLLSHLNKVAIAELAKTRKDAVTLSALLEDNARGRNYFRGVATAVDLARFAYVIFRASTLKDGTEYTLDLDVKNWVIVLPAKMNPLLLVPVRPTAIKLFGSVLFYKYLTQESASNAETEELWKEDSIL